MGGAVPCTAGSPPGGNINNDSPKFMTMGGDQPMPRRVRGKRPKKEKREKCKYDITRGDCDPTTKVFTITKTPKEGQPESCEEQVIEKRCKGKTPKVKCQYQKPTIPACADGERTITRLPVEGSDPSCQPRSRTKKCRAQKTKCTFGEWGDYGDCVEGVKTRTRPVLTGDQAKCAAKATKTRRCQN
ncbi:Hypp8961 [Branchiostoma lanceolatum]|nr:Hypp8961 [Branchiostoma lanceolatum]